MPAWRLESVRIYRLGYKQTKTQSSFGFDFPGRTANSSIMGDSFPRIRTSEPASRINVPFVVSRGHMVQKHFERTQLMSQCDFKREEN